MYRKTCKNQSRILSFTKTAEKPVASSGPVSSIDSLLFVTERHRSFHHSSSLPSSTSNTHRKITHALLKCQTRDFTEMVSGMGMFSMLCRTGTPTGQQKSYSSATFSGLMGHSKVYLVQHA